MLWGERVSQPVAADYTGVVALKKPCNLGTSILQPASDSKWIYVDFMDLGVFWGEKVANL